MFVHYTVSVIDLHTVVGQEVSGIHKVTDRMEL